METTQKVKVKILFLDDDKERHELFDAAHDKETFEITHVWNLGQLIEWLSKDKFDMFYLDHDLNDFTGPPTYGGRASEITGTDVAKWLAQNLPEDKRPDRIIIHSWNPDGARRMQGILDDAGFKHVSRDPFGGGDLAWYNR